MNPSYENKRNKIVSRFILFIFLGLLPIVFVTLKQWSDYEVIEAALAHPAEPKYIALAKAEAVDATKGTRFAEHWAVNQRPDLEKLTILIFRSSATIPGPLLPYVRNCAFTGHRPIVICDASIVDWLENRWDGEYTIDAVDQHYVKNDPCTTGSMCGHILLWLISHEIGHILAGHGPSKFSHGALDNYVSDAAISEQKELVADEFAIQRAGRPTKTSDDFYGLLISALNAEIFHAVCPGKQIFEACPKMGFGAGLQLPAREGNTPIEFSTEGTHPAFLIRTIRLLKMAQEKYNMQFFGSLIDRVAKEDLKFVPRAALKDTASKNSKP